MPQQGWTPVTSSDGWTPVRPASSPPSGPPATPVAANEPDTLWAGRLKGAGQYLSDLAESLMNTMAHPGLSSVGTDPRTGREIYQTKPGSEGASDFLPLMLPAARTGVNALRDVGTGPPPSERPVTDMRGMIRSAGTELRQSPGGGFTAKTVGRILQAVPEKQTFNDLPLAQQMEHLPQRGPMPEGRSSIPIQQPQTPFHELPLASQVNRLPTSGVIPEGRFGSPVQAPQTPFHELPLYQQAPSLPDVAAPNVGRGPAPPYRPSGTPLPPNAPRIFTGTPQTPTAPAAPPADMLVHELMKRYPDASPANLQNMVSAARGEPTAVASHSPLAPPPPSESALNAPRVARGAEVVARETPGMTKQDVRNVTNTGGPQALGEPQVNIPQEPNARVRDKMLAMHPDPGNPVGDELANLRRMNYLRDANPKFQTEWMARADEWARQHKGVIGPVGGAGMLGLLRQALLGQMHDPQEQE